MIKKSDGVTRTYKKRKKDTYIDASSFFEYILC